MPQNTETPLVQRKLFNCIVDDTALIAGLKKSTRNGIKQWVNNESIRLFVPLHSTLAVKQRSANSTNILQHLRDSDVSLGLPSVSALTPKRH